MIGEVLWTPPDDLRASTEMGRYLDWLSAQRGLEFDNYEDLWRWSIDDLEGFWSSIWEFFSIQAHNPYQKVLVSDGIPGSQWFPGARLNYAEHLVNSAADDALAVIAYSQTRSEVRLTFGELRNQVAKARAGLRRVGISPGDRVVGYLPNIPETLVAFIATASLGAVWAACAPELGARSVIDRLAQIEPKVLLTVGGYGYRDRQIDCRATVAAVRSAIPSIECVVDVPYGQHSVEDALGWDELLREPEVLEFEAVPFDHPLCVLFSSGTTGLPKAIVHGHGGLLLEHMKCNALQWDLKPGGRLTWFTTTTWMMWNILVSALLVQASIVMIDGDPAWPDLDEQWRLVEQTRPTFLGISPTMVMSCRKAGLQPGRRFDLSSVRVVGTAGSPLPAEGYRYLYDVFGPRLLLLNTSGGTDLCTGIVGGSPWQPVYEGRISGACLGVAAAAFDDDCNRVVNEVGELVITRPMPSMPLRFWNDPDGSRYRSSYFDRYPGIWRHGDWVEFNETGSCVIRGRSDATLNRGGVRLGTNEVYDVVEELDDVVDSLVVHLEDHQGGAGELVLFVVLAPERELNDDLRRAIRKRLRAELSPRHVPDKIVAVPAIPRTLTGKKLEMPVKRILQGARVDQVASRDALADPAALDPFVALGS